MTRFASYGGTELEYGTAGYLGRLGGLDASRRLILLDLPRLIASRAQAPRG